MGGGVGGEVLRFVTGAAQLRGRAAANATALADGAAAAAAISGIPAQWVPDWHGVAPQSEQGRAG